MMNKLFVVLAAVACLLMVPNMCVTAFALEMTQEQGAKRLNIMPHNVFCHSVYTDKESVRIQIGGMLPNGCYSNVTVSAVVDEENKEILISNSADFNSYQMCTMSLIPYLMAVDLGFLKAGSYRVVVESMPGVVQEFANISVVSRD
ncbi:MAG: hypothetical protein AABZ06_01720 [Bdellovibrionota bacterium]